MARNPLYRLADTEETAVKAITKLTDDDVDRLILQFLEDRKEQGGTEDEMQAILDWATQAVVDHMLLSLALNGDIRVNVRDGQPVFFRPNPVTQQ